MKVSLFILMLVEAYEFRLNNFRSLCLSCLFLRENLISELLENN